MNTVLGQIEGILFDLDGVLYIGDRQVDGAAMVIEKLKGRGLPCRFSTNTTTKSRQTLFAKITRLGLPIEEHEIISAPEVSIRYLRSLGNPTCYFCINDDLKQDFTEFPESESKPDFVVIGDIEDRWDYPILNKMFRMIIEGAEIIALHKGRYWHEPDGLRLDIGTFVAGLEYATGKTAEIIGKPNRMFFQLAVEDMGLTPDKTIMVGDDLISDIGGAQKAGLKSMLVKTGKYREHLAATSEIRPDAIFDSVADLPALLSL